MFLFLHFFQLFITKNAENEDFNPRLDCAAPKRRSKYTTAMIANLEYLDKFPDCLKPCIWILTHAIELRFPDRDSKLGLLIPSRVH